MVNLRCVVNFPFATVSRAVLNKHIHPHRRSDFPTACILLLLPIFVGYAKAGECDCAEICMRREYFILEWYMNTRICENAFKTISCFRRFGRTVESTFALSQKQGVLLACHATKATEPRFYEYSLVIHVTVYILYIKKHDILFFSRREFSTQ